MEEQASSGDGRLEPNTKRLREGVTLVEGDRVYAAMIIEDEDARDREEIADNALDAEADEPGRCTRDGVSSPNNVAMGQLG